ncbi:MAG: transglycosylase SLT domain-containing protein [Methylococcaceae bacterium]|nr:transglycosylase SLT domain-containing protein [Methylococcaceae bacterium]
MTKLLMSFLVALIFSSAALADVYKYTGSDGKVYYTDTPPNKKYKRIIRTKVIVNIRNKPTGLNLSSVSKKKYGKISRYARANKKKYTPYIKQAAKKYRVSEKLLHAVILAESAYNPNAVSSAGAVGLMQLMPATARRYGVTNRNDPKQNISGGARYLRDLLKMFNSNLTLAVASYNAGEGAVKKYNNSIPPYKETRNYVKKVLAFYKS